MPSWGRPPGGKKGKDRKRWEQQQWDWESSRRFEEIDSDSDDGQGVDLGHDELYFTGGDLGRSRDQETPDDSDYSSSGDVDEPRTAAAMQVVLREKEDVLVARALERIRRARLLGKTNVKLTPSERDALERKILKDQEKTQAKKSKQPTLKSRSSNIQRDGGQSSGTRRSSTPTNSIRRKSRSSLSSRSDKEATAVEPAPPPGFVATAPDGRQLFVPVGYYPPSPGSPYGPSSRPESRQGSSHSLNYTAPSQAAQSRAQPKQRYSSDPAQHYQSYTTSRDPPSPRPMPDDLNWQPRPRSSSNLIYPPDSYQYPVYPAQMPQLPPQYSQGRRVISGPASVGYPPALRPGIPAHMYTASSDPSQLRREYAGGTGYAEGIPDEDFEDDDEDEGVQVDVVPYGGSYEIVSSAAGPSTGRQRRSRR
jgi:hypothetical protein